MDRIIKSLASPFFATKVAASGAWGAVGNPRADRLILAQQVVSVFDPRTWDRVERVSDSEFVIAVIVGTDRPWPIDWLRRQEAQFELRHAAALSPPELL